MATVKTVIDSSTPANAANTNKFLTGTGESGTTFAAACWGVRIRYNAGWEAVPAFGAVNEVGNIAFVWNAVSDRLEVDLSGCTNQFSSKCIPVVSKTSNGLFHEVSAAAATADIIHVQFHDIDDGTIETTESSSMDFNMIMFGEIG